MFDRFFSNKKYSSRTGVFRVEGDNLIEIEDVPGRGSINDYVESIGFPSNYIHVVFNLNSKKIIYLGFKIFSKQPVLVFTKDKNQKITDADVKNALKSIDWKNEYSTFNKDGFLDLGMEYGNLSLEFLKSVIDLKKEEGGLYRSEDLGLYLQFDEIGMLESYSSSSWDNASTRWLRSFNDEMVKKYINEATKFHDNEIDIMQEVNSQTAAMIKVPYAVNNEYTKLHRTGSVVNFYNLLITHYTKACKKEDFLFMNKGRYSEMDINTYRVGNYVYTFDNNNELAEITSNMNIS